MIVISTKEFRANQKAYFDQVDQGVQVIVQRGDNKAYALTPVSQDDMYFTPEMVKRLRESIEEVKNGEFVTFNTPAELKDYLKTM